MMMSHGVGFYQSAADQWAKSQLFHCITDMHKNAQAAMLVA